MDVMYAQRRRVRSPVGAGLFYPDERAEILNILDSFGLDKTNADQETACKVKAIIAPHGAWSYSGALAARAFALAAGRSHQIKRVVILGPIHDKREKGLFLSNSHSFNTPLGNIRVDRQMSEELEKTGESFEINDIPHLGEHSIEILLPFVKHCFPNAMIVPILMGQGGAQYIFDLTSGLKSAIAPVLDETLIVVSCNLSCSKDANTALLLARESLNLFKNMNAPALASAILENRLNACGGALVVSLFESGLVNKAVSCCAQDELISAVSAEKNTVYYSALSFE